MFPVVRNIVLWMPWGLRYLCYTDLKMQVPHIVDKYASIYLFNLQAPTKHVLCSRYNSRYCGLSLQCTILQEKKRMEKRKNTRYWGIQKYIRYYNEAQYAIVIKYMISDAG